MATKELFEYSAPIFNPEAPSPLIYKYSWDSSAEALALNDVIVFWPLAKNAMPTGGFLATSDLDTDGSPAITLDVEVTDGTTTHTLVTASAIGQAGGQVVFPGGTGATAQAQLTPYGTRLDTDNYVIQIKVSAAAATAATSGYFTLCLYWTFANE